MKLRIPAVPVRPAAALLAALAISPTASGQVFYKDVILQDQPLVYWNFDEASGSAQQLASLTAPGRLTDNDLVPVDGATRISHADVASGLRLGRALSVNGTNFVRAAQMRTGLEELPGAYAIEMWVQSLGENPGTYFANFGTSPGGDNSPAVIYRFNDTHLELFGGAGGRTGTAGPKLTDAAWHHLMVVYYGSGEEGVAFRTDLWLDGLSTSAADSLSRRLNLSSLIVGAGLPNKANAFNGRIDELAVYDLSDLTTEQAVNARVSDLVQTHRAAALAPSGPAYASVVQEDAPFLYWNFDEVEGPALQLQPVEVDPEVIDNSLNTLDPTGDAGRITHAAAGSGLSLGSAATFAGEGSFQKTGGFSVPADVSAAPWAVELWFQFGSAQANRYLLNVGSDSRNSPAVIYGYFGPKLEVFGPSGRSGENFGVPVDDRSWHHLLVVNYGAPVEGSTTNRIDFFLDNVQHVNTGGGFTQPFDLRDWLIFGAATPENSGGLEGNLDELAVYSMGGLGNVAAIEAKAKSMAASHYAAGFGVTSVGTITITRQPAGGTSAIGQTATFTVEGTVTGTDLPLTWQWFRNGLAIPGATGPSWTTPPLTLNDVGTVTYTARGSAGPAFRVSDPAELVVPAPPAEPPTAYAQQVISDQPLLYWNFDEMTGPAEQLMPASVIPVTTENDLEPTGTAGDRIAHQAPLISLGRALQLDGSSFLQSGPLRLPVSALTGAWAVEFWMKHEGLAGEPVNSYIANFGNPGSDNSPAFIFGFNADRLEVFGSSGRSAANGPALNDSNWHHVLWVNYAVPVNTVNRVEVFVDGVLKTEAGGGFGQPVTLTSFLFGAALPSGVNGFLGALDEFAVHNFAGLTPTEIATRSAAMSASRTATAVSGLNYAATVLADAPLLYYNFDEAGGVAKQIAPVVFPPDSSTGELVPTGAGRIRHSVATTGLALGNAADFDGRSHYLADQLTTGVLAGPWAVEYWMQVVPPNDGQRDDYLLNFGSNSPAFIFDFKPDELEIFAGARTDAGPVVADQQWHHVFWVFYPENTGAGRSAEVDVIFDGRLLTGIQNDYAGSLVLNGRLVAGASQPGYDGFLGRLDELAVYRFNPDEDPSTIRTRATGLAGAHYSLATGTAPPAPATLNITRTGPNSAVLTWSEPGYTLQESDGLAGWTDLPAATSLFEVTVPATGSGRKYYRLIRR